MELLPINPSARCATEPRAPVGPVEDPEKLGAAPSVVLERTEPLHARLEAARLVREILETHLGSVDVHDSPTPSARAHSGESVRRGSYLPVVTPGIRR
jgi:hypothetical protein